MLTPRYFQRDALDELYKYWQEEDGGNGLIVIPTGGGKALIIALLIMELLEQYPDMRIINLTHSAKLVAQNAEEFINLSPFAPAGIYSAGLGQRDTNSQILFAGIQSVWDKLDVLGSFDLVIIDEAHAISRNIETRYGKFFTRLREINDDFRLVGLTATDYRTDSGRLTEGDGKMFDKIVYEIGIGKLIEEGYLTPLTSQKTLSKIDLTGVRTVAGEYNQGQLGEAAEAIIEDAVAEDVDISHDRKAALIFCASKANAVHVAEAFQRHGRNCAWLTSDNEGDQEQIFADFDAGKIWGVASVGKITTGANFKRVDFISLMLSTKAPGKVVQMLGRGTRLYPGKTDCLVSDHGRNLSRHGPVDMIKAPDPSSGGGQQPQKLCPQDGHDVEGKTGCGELLAISIMTCPCCGYVFPPSDEEKITAKADITPVLSTERPWSPVDGRAYAPWPAKVEGKPPTVRATYTVGAKKLSEWLCPEHEGFAKSKSDRYWSLHSGKRPFPQSVDEFLDRAGELMATTELQLDYSKSSKYPEIKAHRVGDATYGTDVVAPANDNAPTGKTGNLAAVLGTRKVDSAAADRAAAARKAELRAFAEDFIPY